MHGPTLRTKLSLALMVALFGLTLAFTVCKEVNSHQALLVVMKTLNNPYYVEMDKGVSQAAGMVGESFVVQREAYDREDDVEGQVTTINSALRRGGLAAVSIAPASSQQLAPTIAELNGQGVFVVVVDTRMDEAALKEAGAHIDAFVGSDNERGGELAGMFLAEEIGKGEQLVLFLEGVPTQETAISRKEGFTRLIDEESFEWNLKRRVANWNREEGRSAVSSVLNTEGIPEGIFAANDEMALGAVAALEDAGVGEGEWPVIVGFDATPDALRAVSAGKMAKTIEQQPFEMGRAAVELAVGLIRGTVESGEERMIPVELVP